MIVLLWISFLKAFTQLFLSSVWRSWFWKQNTLRTHRVRGQCLPIFIFPCLCFCSSFCLLSLICLLIHQLRSMMWMGTSLRSSPQMRSTTSCKLLPLRSVRTGSGPYKLCPRLGSKNGKNGSPQKRVSLAEDKDLQKIKTDSIIQKKQG